MADNKPVPKDRKARLLAPLAIAAVVAAVLLVVVAQRSPQPPTPLPPVPPAPKPVQPVAAANVAPVPLTRAELIEHARAVAATFAATGKMPPPPDPLIGRRFSLRIAFGCNGISGGYTGSQTSVTYDSQNQSVTLVAQPGDWTALPLVQTLPDASEVEAAEGFWLPRIWLNEDVCPQRTDFSAPATPTPPTAPWLGLAQIFMASDSRLVRHAEHPYQFTRKIPGNALELLDHSYRLVLEGSIHGFTNHEALQCWVESPDHQPLCLYGVALDHVAFVDGETGEVLAAWSD